MISEELSELIEALQDNPEEVDCLRRLNGLLSRSSEARREYLLQMSVKGAISERWKPPMTLKVLRERIAAGAENEARLRKKRVAVSVFAAAACIAIIGTVFAWIRSANPPAKAAIVGTTATLYSVERKDFSNMGHSTGELLGGDRLVVSRGSVKIAVGNVAVAFAEAPATLELVAWNEVAVVEGNVYFDIARRDASFRVTTRKSKYVDLGTTFGVGLFPDGSEELSVFSGKVAASPEKGGRTVMVAEGQTLLVEKGKSWRAGMIAQRKASYRTSLSGPVSNALRWTFDGPDPAAVSGNHPDLGVIDPEFMFRGESIPLAGFRVPGRIGDAFRFNGNSPELRTGWKGIEGVEPRTVAVWIKIPENVGLSGVIVEWGHPRRIQVTDRKWKITLNRDADLGPVGALRLTTGTSQQIGTQILNDGRWHHLAITYDGRNVRFYCDGVEDAISNPLDKPIYTETTGEGVFEVMVGGPQRSSEVFGERKGLVGDLDELWIFNSALDAGQVKTLTELNRFDP